MKKIAFMIEIFVVLLSIMITACDNTSRYGNILQEEKPEYIKKNITLKFKNESGVKCYIEISGNSDSGITSGVWAKTIQFPTVLKTEIPVGEKKSITVKDVVVSGKSHLNTRTYQQHVTIKAFSDDSLYSRNGYEYIVGNLENQFTGGTFYIKLKGLTAFGLTTFDIDFIN